MHMVLMMWHSTHQERQQEDEQEQQQLQQQEQKEEEEEKKQEELLWHVLLQWLSIHMVLMILHWSSCIGLWTHWCHLMLNMLCRMCLLEVRGEAGVRGQEGLIEVGEAEWEGEGRGRGRQGKGSGGRGDGGGLKAEWESEGRDKREGKMEVG